MSLRYSEKTAAGERSVRLIILFSGFRDGIYKTPRELAMSYAHEYFMWDGKKSLRAYSKPFDLSKYPPEKMGHCRGRPNWPSGGFRQSPHFPILPKMKMKMRPVSKIEIKKYA